jgi:hypothetical protein
MAVKTPPDTEAKIVIMRAAGFSLPIIASKTSVSTSTVKRVLKRHPPPSEESQLDLVEEARTALRDQYGSDDAMSALYASLLADTLHHVETSREIANASLAKLKAADTKDAALVFRALTAHATTLKTHVDTVKAIAPLPEMIAELPVLHVTGLTEEDIEEIKRVQDEEEELMGDPED